RSQAGMLPGLTACLPAQQGGIPANGRGTWRQLQRKGLAGMAMVEIDIVLRQPVQPCAVSERDGNALARGPFRAGLVPLGGARRGQQRMRALADPDIDGKLVSCGDTTWWVQDDGMANLRSFRIQRLLHRKRAFVRTTHHDGAVFCTIKV